MVTPEELGLMVHEGCFSLTEQKEMVLTLMYGRSGYGVVVSPCA